MASKPKKCISRYLGGLGRGGRWLFGWEYGSFLVDYCYYVI
jgi:hypothetical protein